MERRVPSDQPRQLSEAELALAASVPEPAPEGIGWKRIATANDSAQTTLGLLATGARIGGAAASVRHERDNQIHEIYVW